MILPPGQTFFLPGPVAVHPDVLAAMQQPMVSHRTPEMSSRLAAMQPTLRMIFRTERPVLVATSSATGLMEAVVTSAVRRKMLCVTGGFFGERFARIAELCGREVVRVAGPPDAGLDPAVLIAALRAAPDVEAVSLVHSETGSGVLAPLAELAAAVRAHSDALVLADAVTSVGALPVETDAWGLDFVFTGSQKALGLPPGLAFGVASDRLLRRAAAVPARGWYFDLVNLHRMAEQDLFPQTPALPIVYALEFQLGRIAREGLEPRWRRHATMRSAVDAWAETQPDARIVAAPGARSCTVTALAMPDGVEAGALAREMAARSWTLTDGLPPFESRHLRIGHMGDMAPEHLIPMLDVLGDVLRGAHARR